MSEDTNDQATQLEVIAPFMENAEPGLSVGGNMRDRPAQRLLNKLNGYGKIRKAAISMLAIGVSVGAGIVGIQQYVGMEQRAALNESFPDSYMAVLRENLSGAERLTKYRNALAIAPATAVPSEVDAYAHNHETSDPVLEAVLAELDSNSEMTRPEVAGWFTEHGIDSPVIRDALNRHGIEWVDERQMFMVDRTRELVPDMAPSLGNLQHTIAVVAAETGATLPQAASMLSDGLEGLMVKSDLCQTGGQDFCITDQIVIQGDKDALVFMNAWNGLMGIDLEVPRTDSASTIDMDDFGADGSDNRPQRDAALGLEAGSAGVLTITRVRENGVTEVVAGYGDAEVQEIIEEISGGMTR